MSLARRVLAAVLAVLPVGWGLCVTWVASAAEAGALEAPCSCCCPSQAPDAPDSPHAPDDCPGCGFKDAGRGVVRAETVPDLPEAHVVAPAPTPVAVASPERRGSVERVEGTSGPPLLDRLSSVVLLI